MSDKMTFQEFQELVRRLSEARTKLDRLEEKKSSVRESVYKKVKEDYETRVRAVEAEMEGKGGSIEEVFASYTGETQELTKKREAVDAEIEELSLRHYLGEFKDDEYKRLEKEKKTLIANMNEQMEDLTRRIEFIRQYLPGGTQEETVAETVEELDTEAVKEEAKAEARPAEVFTGYLEATAEPETETATEEVAAEPMEDSSEGEATVQAIAAEIEDEAVPQAVEKPGEILSEEEADRLIEQSISEAEEVKDIMKQPELAPDAKEKEGVECSKCHLVNEPDSWYCEKCGAELLQEEVGS